LRVEGLRFRVWDLKYRVYLGLPEGNELGIDTL
jgi:hypothetical protein